MTDSELIEEMLSLSDEHTMLLFEVAHRFVFIEKQGYKLKSIEIKYSKV